MAHQVNPIPNEPLDKPSADKKKRPLGKGLSALLGPDPETTPSALQEVSVDRLIPGKYQPRKTIDNDALQELANSIKENGLVQPIVVRDFGDQFEIIAGERRWRAAKLAQLKMVPVLVRDLTDKQALELGIIENIQREDLNAVEEAKGYDRLMAEFSYTQENLSAILGKSRSHIANTLRLLKHPEDVQQLVIEKKLSPGHARALLTHPDPSAAAKEVIKKNLNVRQTEKLLDETRPKSARPRSTLSANLSEVGEMGALITDLIGLKTTISHEEAGKGVVKIHFESLDQLDRLFSIFSEGTQKIL